jgi:phage terminase large subunit-like protein
MVTVALEREQTIKPGLKGFFQFCDLIDEPLEPHQKRMARSWLESEARESVVIAPKGQHKTTTLSLVALHELLSNPTADIVVGASRRDQGNIALRRIKGFAQHPAVADRVEALHWEMRSDTGGQLRLIASDGPGLAGVSPSLMIGDEPWCWQERSELLAHMEASLLKNPVSRLLLISTAAARMDGPLGRLRARALAQPNVRRRGAVLESWGSDLRWLEWSLPESTSTEDWRAIRRCNPASYITTRELRLQRKRLGEGHFLQLHCCRWGVGEAAWLPHGAWDDCAGDASIADGEEVLLGIDIGGKRSASAIAIVTPDLRVNVEVYQGETAVLKVFDRCLELGKRYKIRELVYDPMRFAGEAERLKREGYTMVQIPQSPGRLTEISESLLSVIVERRLTHGNDPELNRHVANAIAVETDRGWRLSKPRETDQIDAVIAVGLAVHRALVPPKQPTRVLGYL